MDYLLRISPEEFEYLKENQDEVVSEVLLGLPNDRERKELENSKLSLKYNVKRGLAGIFIKIDEHSELALHDSLLDDKYREIVRSFYQTLQEKIDFVRSLPDEKWTDSLEKIVSESSVHKDPPIIDPADDVPF